MRRLLVTRLRYLGDVVLSTPLLEVLRARFPGARLEYLVEERFGPVLEGHPALDRIHLLPARPGPRATVRLAGALRRPRVDWCFDLFGNPRSAVLVGLAQPRHSVGPARGLRSRVYEWRRGRPPGDRSALRHHLDKLVPLLGEEVEPRRPRIHLEPGRIEAGARRAGGAPGSPFTLVHPGATWPDKRWPHDRWPALIAGLERRGLGPVVVIEPPDVPGVAKEIVERTGGAARALPSLGLRDLLGVVGASQLYVGNDGGILHAAVALGVPTVGLLGPTEPDIWFPYERFGPYRCVHHCDPPSVGPDGRPVSRLRGLAPQRVLEAVERVTAAPRVAYGSADTGRPTGTTTDPAGGETR